MAVDFTEGRRRTRHLLCCGLTAVLLVLSCTNAAQAQQTERARQKEVAEAERAALEKKLQDLKRSISRTEVARSSAAEALAETESAISKARRSLRDLSDEQKLTTQRLAQLAAQQAGLEKTVERQQKQLAKLLRQHYIDSGTDRIKLFMSGDNPNRIHRDLQYLGYLSQAQAELIESLRDNLRAVEAKRAEALNAKRELDEIAQEDREQKALLDREKSQRATLLAQLSGKLESQRREAGAIARDQQRLSGLVDKLQKLIEEQRQADAAARAKRNRERQELAAKKKAESERRRTRDAAAAKRGVPPPATNPDAIDDDEPPQAAKNGSAPKDESNAPSDEKGGAFAALRGQLKVPVQGTLASRFGTRRSDGPPWKGLFFRAADGSDVHSVAAGRVVFADWLRGFGNLIIVDHGNQYMTIYGNNQAVLKRAGDRVGAGDVIASAGNSGGNEQSGLYFEMRHQGRAFDPLGWLNLR